MLNEYYDVATQLLLIDIIAIIIIIYLFRIQKLYSL
jgi:hypothetical protein